jgi:mannan polymerase II complex ANP1 subunit
MEMEIDGVGGVSILAKARVFRAGVHFPAFSFEKHAETEGFGKMAKRMGFSVVGLPHYTVWHLYEPSEQDLQHMQEMEDERKARAQEEKEREERMKKIKEEFKDPNSQWEKDKAGMAEKTRQDEKAAGDKKAPEAEQKPEQKADAQSAGPKSEEDAKGKEPREKKASSD